jgi:hypothetical protein
VPTGQPAPEAVPPSLLAWAQVVDVSRLSDKTVRKVERYLRGYRHMTLNDRKEWGFLLVAAVEAQVSPPPPVNVSRWTSSRRFSRCAASSSAPAN